MKVKRLGFLISATALLLIACAARAQYVVNIRSGPSNPANCTVTAGAGEAKLFWNTTDSKFKYCCSPNTWCNLGATVPGANTQVIFNDAGAFGADAGMTYDKAGDKLTVGSITATGSHQISMTERAAPSSPGAGVCTQYGDSTGHELKAACNTGAYRSVFPTNVVTEGSATGQAQGTTQYYGFGYNAGGSENLVYRVLPLSGFAKGFHFGTSVAPGAGESFTGRVRKNGSNTSVTCVISDTNTTCSDLSNSFTFTAGDYITFAATSTAGTGSGRMRFGLVLHPD